MPAAALSPKSPMTTATWCEPQSSAEPTVYAAQTRARTSCWTRLRAPPDPGGHDCRAPGEVRCRSAPLRVVVGDGGELTGPSRSASPPGPAGPGALDERACGGCWACGGDGCGCRDVRRGRHDRSGLRDGRGLARRCARVAVGGPAASDRSSIGRASPVAPPSQSEMSIPGAERSAAQPLPGRYTSLVTQGHSSSTLRDDQRRCVHAPLPEGRGGYRKRMTPVL